MSWDRRIGIAGLILAAFALAAPNFWPDNQIVPWSALSLSIAFVGVWVFAELWAFLQEGPKIMSIVVAIITGAALGASAGAFAWVAARHSSTSIKSDAKPIDSAKGARSETPNAIPSGTSTDQRFTPDTLAAEIADRLRKSDKAAERDSEPYPPYDLGGSVEESDFRDVFLTFRDWKPVPKAVDVQVDWSRFANKTELVVDALVKGKSGSCYVGLWDVANQVTVAESDPVMVNGVGTNVTFKIPREHGVKTYRLVTRGSKDGNTAFYGALGAITFPIETFGGGSDPSASSDVEWHQVQGSRTVDVNWSDVRPPINKIVLEAMLVVSDYSPDEQTVPPPSSARLRLRNLTTGQVVVECGWVAAGRRSMHHSYWPNRQPCKQQLPKEAGKARYALEISTSRVGVRVAAQGRLLFRH